MKRYKHNATLGIYTTLHSVRRHRAFDSRRQAHTVCAVYNHRAQVITVFGSHRAVDVYV